MEYVRSEDLQPVPGPKARSADLVARLDSWDWVKVSESLNDARLLALIMEKVVLGILDAMKNPRSAVLKTSVMACAYVFAAFGNLISFASADAFESCSCNCCSWRCRTSGSCARRPRI